MILSSNAAYSQNEKGDSVRIGRMSFKLDTTKPKDTTYYFSREQILKLTRQIRELQEEVNQANKLIAIDDTLITAYQINRTITSDLVVNMTNQNTDLKKQNEELRGIIQSMSKTYWYEDRTLIFVTGFVIGTAASYYLLKK